MYISTLLLTLLLLQGTSEWSTAQSPGDSISTGTDSISLPRHALYGGLGYGSNMIYLGSSLSSNQPFAYGALSYAFRSELFLTFSGMHLGSISPALSLFTASASYNHTFNSWYDISAGIYGYFPNASALDTLFGKFAYADLTNGFDWKILYTKVSVGAILASEPQIYLQFRNSRWFQTSDFFRGKANLSFDPYFNITAGTYTYAQIVQGTDTVFSSTRGFGNGSQTIRNTTGTEYSRKFSLMEAGIGLPVSLNFDALSLEAEAGYVLPLYDESNALNPDNGFVLMFSCIFKIL